MHAAFSRIDHRPWSLPNRAWAWRQSWHDLLFAHWPIPKEKIRHLVPERLDIHEYDGSSWIGIVPFRMEGVMRRPLPDLPGISAFQELNVRLYVEYQGKPGVWFLSLDAANPLAVWAARKLFNLPYFLSRMTLAPKGDGIEYCSIRRSAALPAKFQAAYWPMAGTFEATKGSLEHWLTERYCLYAQSPAGKLYRTEVHHHPWSLRLAGAEIRENTMVDSLGLPLQGPPPLLHFSRSLDVVVWSPELLVD